MSQATEAFERGDFARARELSRGTAEEADIFRRTGPDRLILQIAVACVGLFVLVVALFHGS
jgi:hypothetical protein